MKRFLYMVSIVAASAAMAACAPEWAPLYDGKTTDGWTDVDGNAMPADSWSVVEGGHIEHWLNGAKVLEPDRFSHAFDVLVTNSKFKEEKGFGKLEGGHIILQDHGSRVRYRDIMIREL